MPIHLVLADFDGTLVDSMPFWKRLPRGALQAGGIPEPADMDELIRTHPMWEIAQIFAARYPALGGSDALYARWMAEMAENYRTRIPFKPGALALLTALNAAGVRVCLLTATNHGLLDGALESYGLLPYLADVVTEGDAGASKRSSAPYTLCLNRLGARAEETLLLEDSLPNVRQAKSLALRTCGVYDESMAAFWDEMRLTADVALRSLADIAPLLAFIRR